MTHPSTPARLRELVAALPEHQRLEHWSVIGDGEPAVIEAGGMWVVDCGYGARPTAHLIATMDPPVVLAIADVIEARSVLAAAHHQYDRRIVQLLHAIDALDAALRRSQP